ncbi:MAG: hypothetical protein P4L27_06385 [Ignavibacteriaceae bacterium]|nr:hypothetical protein [Ignavibacteriaceae bacterium]
MLSSGVYAVIKTTENKSSESKAKDGGEPEVIKDKTVINNDIAEVK